MRKTDRFLFRKNTIMHLIHADIPLTFIHTGPLTVQNTRTGPCRGFVHVAQVGSVSFPGAKNMAPVGEYADVHAHIRHTQGS